MAGFTSTNTDYLTRANLWSNQLKDVLEDELYAQRYIDWITDFPDGDTLNIPSIGQAEVYDYTENDLIQYSSFDTGNFTFTITDYKASATYVTDKQKQDSFYMSRVISQFVPKQHRALMKRMELDVLRIGPAAQTTADPNVINGANHRFVGSGTNETMAIEDFAKAMYALKQANVPQRNLVAIVDPSVEYMFNTLTNIVNVTNNPRWEGLIASGMTTGMTFIKNVLGFDVYVSQNLHVNTASETINPGSGNVTAAAGVNNLFFSADSAVLPFVGCIRQPARVESKRNIDRQRDEYVTTCRYGFKLYRPENLVCVVTDTDQVYA